MVLEVSAPMKGSSQVTVSLGYLYLAGVTLIFFLIVACNYSIGPNFAKKRKNVALVPT